MRSATHNSSQTLLQNQEEGFFDPVLTHIPNYGYLDLAALWTVTHNVQVRLGVNNLLDKDPPFIPSEVSSSSGQINSFQTYDLLGREIYAAFRATF